MPEVLVNPTLVVGIGGTGCHVAKLLRKMVEQDVDSRDRDRIPMRFIGIDTDLKDMNSHDGDEAPLHYAMEIAGKAKALGDSDDKGAAAAAFRAWLPKNRAGKFVMNPEHLAKGEGAGGKRLLGRYAFKYFAPFGFDSAQRQVEQLRDLCNNPILEWRGLEYVASDRLDVYVVCSLAGGTGSGGFLDALAMCHRLCDEAAPGLPRGIHLVLVTPSAFQHVVHQKLQPIHKATTYACLKDLDNLMSDLVPKTFEFHGNRSVTVKGRIADDVFLLGRHGAAGTVTQIEELFRILAIQLYAMIGTPMGTAFKTVSNNNVTLDQRDNAGGRKRYSAFGLVGLDYDLATRQYRAASSVARDAVNAIRFGLAESPLTEEDARAEALVMLKPYLNGAAAMRITDLMGSRASALLLPSAVEDEHPKDVLERIQTSSGMSEASLLGNIKTDMATRWTGSKNEGTSGWRGEFEANLYGLINRFGTAGARSILYEVERFIIQAKQAVEERLRASSLTAVSADAKARLERIGAFAWLMRRERSNMEKLSAIELYNNGVEAVVRELACAQVAEVVFGSKGLNSVVEEVAQRIRSADDLAMRAGEVLDVRSHAGESPLATALDRSQVIYDVVREWHDLPSGDEPNRGSECFRAWVSSISPDNAEKGSWHATDALCGIASQSAKKKEAPDAKLADILSEVAMGLIDHNTREHILDVMMPDESDSLEKNLRRTLRNLTPLALVDQLDPDDAPFDTTQALVPASEQGVHPKQARFEEVFGRLCSELRHGQAGCETFGGRTNRLIISKWILGFALNDKAYSPLAELRTNYRQERPRNDFLDVDARWIGVAGPGEGLAGGRKLAWALGLAYGLIAQEGSRYFNNLKTKQRREAEVRGTREEHEVDAELILHAIGQNRPITEWLPTLITAPATQILGRRDVPLALTVGKKRPGVKRNSRELIGGGRDTAMLNFANDVGEDFGDLELGIVIILNAYTAADGRGAIISTLEGYRDRLSAIKTPSDRMELQLEEEVSMINLALENLQEHGKFGLSELSELNNL